jgi:hypothetical protein
VAPPAPTVSDIGAAEGGEVAAIATPTAGLTVTDAEYFVGADPGVGGGTTLAVSPAGAGTFALSSSGASLVAGDVINVRAKDNFGQWGDVTTFVVTSAAP